MKKHVGLILLLCNIATFAQPRINDHNNIGWYTTTATLKFADKWSAHLEYQWRRDNYITRWQQSLLRTGINYHVNNHATLRLGYGWIETYPYGKYTINTFGKQFTEHRIYQALTTTQRVGIFDLTHRYKLEQRWLATYNNGGSIEPDKWTYLNRLRYQLRAQVPLKKQTGEQTLSRFPYMAAYNEVFIGFGKNAGYNIFDQNRTAGLLGYQFNKTFRAEAGYLCQIVQLNRQIGFRNILQYNQGVVVNTVFNVDVRKQKQ